MAQMAKVAERAAGLGSVFARELEKWSRTGEIPQSANQDVAYALDLQREKLESRGLRIEYELDAPGGNGNDAMMGGVRTQSSVRSRKYEGRTEYKLYKRRVSIFRNNKKEYSKKERQNMYITTTWLKEEEMTGEETYCCPSCGAISTVKELQEGCSYCGTKFVMSDLFPKVTDYFYVDDVVNPNSFKEKVALFMALGAVVAGTVAYITKGDVTGGMLVYRTLSSAVVGALGGYCIYAFGLVGSLLLKAFASIGPLASQQAAKSKITSVLGGIDPSFSYDYFLNRLVSNLKIILYAKDRGNLAQYVGKDLHPEFDDIIEADINGKLKLNFCRVQNGYCTLGMNVGMNTIHDNGRRIYRKPHMFALMLVKNVSRIEDIGFSIKKAQCKHCGSSFDATKERVCPSCGTPYDLMDDAWVVTDIRKIR